MRFGQNDYYLHTLLHILLLLLLNFVLCLYNVMICICEIEASFVSQKDKSDVLCALLQCKWLNARAFVAVCRCYQRLLSYFIIIMKMKEYGYHRMVRNGLDGIAFRIYKNDFHVNVIVFGALFLWPCHQLCMSSVHAFYFLHHGGISENWQMRRIIGEGHENSHI